jgi:hypothetical protein
LLWCLFLAKSFPESFNKKSHEQNFPIRSQPLERRRRREARGRGPARLSLQQTRRDQRITNTGGGNTSSKISETDPLTGEQIEVLWVKGSGGDLRTSLRENFSSLYQHPN